MPSLQIDSIATFDESINSEEAETNGYVPGEASMVNHENSSHSDLLAQSTVRDHFTTTSDSEGIEHDTVNSIENISMENGRCNDSNVSDEEPEIDPNLENANHDEIDPLSVSTDMVNGDNELGTAQTEQNQTEASSSNVREADPRTDVLDVATVKIEPLPVYDNHVANDNDIDDLLNEPVEDVLDGVIIVIGRSGIPKPLGMTTEKTIKRENDKMSGNTTYSVSVRMHLTPKMLPLNINYIISIVNTFK